MVVGLEALTEPQPLPVSETPVASAPAQTSDTSAAPANDAGAATLESQARWGNTCAGDSYAGGGTEREVPTIILPRPAAPAATIENSENR